MYMYVHCICTVATISNNCVHSNSRNGSTEHVYTCRRTHVHVHVGYHVCRSIRM